jgi:hypothetical protein
MLFHRIHLHYQEHTDRKHLYNETEVTAQSVIIGSKPEWETNMSHLLPLVIISNSSSPQSRSDRHFEIELNKNERRNINKGSESLLIFIGKRLVKRRRLFVLDVALLCNQVYDSIFLIHKTGHIFLFSCLF